MSENAPDLLLYAGDGEDLNQEQREYLLRYAAHEPVAAGDSNPETPVVTLAVEGEDEWA